VADQRTCEDLVHIEKNWYTNSAAAKQQKTLARANQQESL